MPRAFLKARWSNLALLNFSVPPEVLEARLPPELTLDWLDGEAWVSLVAFDFLETEVMGVRWPGHVNFPEINLRFYVRCGSERGVVFVREYVPRRAIAWIAKRIYNEPYEAAPMTSRVRKHGERIRVEHALHVGGRANTLAVEAIEPPLMVPPGSLEHHFKEHRWGFGTDRAGNTTFYEVEHPPWFVYRLKHVEMDWDWELAYGPEWAFLNGREPDSAVRAVGSEVAVYPRQDLEE